MRDNMFAFIHIEKAAGTTLIHLLRRNFLLGYVDVRPLSKGFVANNGLPVFTGSDLKIYRRLNPLIRCIGGHSVVPFSDLESIASDIQYFSVLRDPVDRYLSHYVYRVRKLGVNDSFEAFLDIEMLHNLQAKKFGNTGNYLDALRAVNEKRILIGFADDFDAFLDVLGKYLSPYMKGLSHSRANAGRADLYRGLKDRYYDQIVLANTQDILFYNELKMASVGVPCEVNGISDCGCSGIGCVASMYDKFNWLVRKAYYEPVTGLIRVMNGLSYRGVQL